MSFIPIPIACGVIGVIIGALAGGCTQTCPIILGASLGVGGGGLLSVTAYMSIDTPQTIKNEAETESEAESVRVTVVSALHGAPKDVEENPSNP